MWLALHDRFRSRSGRSGSSLLPLLLLVALLGCKGVTNPADLGACNAPQRGAWTHLGLEGHWVTALAETPWGFFVGTGTGGVFRCDPASGRWQALGLDHAVAASMLFVPGPTPRLLVGMRARAEEQTAAAVFATEDAGRTWLPWDGGLAQRHEHRQWAYSLAMDPGDPERLYMGQSISILRSTDGGRSWQYVFLSPEYVGNGINTIVISPRRDGRIWAGGEGALENGLVLLSQDWGDTWEPVIITPRSDNAVFALAVDESNPARLWAGVRGGVMRSEDYGRSWGYVLTQPGMILSLLLVRDQLFAVGGTFRPIPDPLSDLALYRSNDGGTTWEVLPVPPNAGGANVAILDSQARLLIGTPSQPRGGVWRFQP